MRTALRPRPAAPTSLRRLLVGVRGHGGEEVYSTLLHDYPPAAVSSVATFDFHASCAGARCHPLREVLLNRLVRPWLAFDLGFRVLDVGPDVDLVHVHSHPTVLRGLGRRPVVFSAGSSHWHYVRHYERWSEERIARRYARARRLYRRLGVLDALLTSERITLAYTFSAEAREIYLRHGIPAWKIRVLPPGFDIPAAPVRRPRGTVTYLFLGRQPGRKGGPAVLDAFQRLRATMPTARLLYVTDEPLPAPVPGVDARPLVPPSAVARLYGEADVFVNPTRAEGFGFTNVEAQGFALPVVSSRLGAIPEVVDDGRTGFLIDPDDGEALLAAMRRLGADAGLRTAMARTARERFVARYALPVFQAALTDIYAEAVERAGSAP